MSRVYDLLPWSLEDDIKDLLFLLDKAMLRPGTTIYANSILSRLSHHLNIPKPPQIEE